MDDAKRDPLVDTVRQQQHTGTHEPGPDRFGGTRAGAENVEAPPPITLFVTRTDAAVVNREPDVYVGQLEEALAPYGVEVRFAPDQRGHGHLINVADPMLEKDIWLVINRVKTEPGSTVQPIG